ncbi:MAG: sulfite exporter TauE/SafE family protein [Candidatus Aadella gelida]|nr:sulfite exporter TauE/SafE family protein [Candidatus Aadella gelida]
MEIHNIIIAAIIYYFAGMISVSVGGTSLVTIPLLIFLGMDTKTAIATNMFTLVFMSMSGVIGFRKKIEWSHSNFIFIAVLLTILGSWLGAKLLLNFNEEILERFLAVIICLFLPVFLLKKDIGIEERREESTLPRLIISSFAIFVLGIYGGFFSGGYMMLLSYVLILGLGLNFLQTAGMTKILNLFSSLVACLVFFANDLIDFRIAVPLGTAIFLGGLSGSKLAIRKGNVWVRKVFIIVAGILVVKLLFF